jgi:molybdopterin converting factor small subunit
MAKKLLDAGCPAVMPSRLSIGSGMGVQNPANLRIMREQASDATIIVDAGVGVPSDAAIAMELGADAILMNTAIAESRDPASMGSDETGRRGRPYGVPLRTYAKATLRVGVEPHRRRYQIIVMPVNVRMLFFGATAQIVGQRSIQIELPEDSVARAAFDDAVSRFPELKRHRLLYSVNQAYTNGDERLIDGDEVALFTAVSGG